MMKSEKKEEQQTENESILNSWVWIDNNNKKMFPKHMNRKMKMMMNLLSLMKKKKIMKTKIRIK